MTSCGRQPRRPSMGGTLLAVLLFALSVRAQTTITVATVNNGDMIVMQKLSKLFEREHPEIKLNWIVLEENILREKTTTDVAAHGSQYDVVTIGPLEAPIWGRRGWLLALNDRLPASYAVDDLLKPIRDGASFAGRLYALPFYAESSLTYYRKDLFQKAGLTMPLQPTYNDIARFARVLHDPAHDVYGVCLRGKPGWGENMAYISTLADTFGGRWFDEHWDTAAHLAGVARCRHLLCQPAAGLWPSRGKLQRVQRVADAL